MAKHHLGELFSSPRGAKYLIDLFRARELVNGFDHFHLPLCHAVAGDRLLPPRDEKIKLYPPWDEKIETEHKVLGVQKLAWGDREK